MLLQQYLQGLDLPSHSGFHLVLIRLTHPYAQSEESEKEARMLLIEIIVSKLSSSVGHLVGSLRVIHKRSGTHSLKHSRSYPYILSTLYSVAQSEVSVVLFSPIHTKLSSSIME